MSDCCQQPYQPDNQTVAVLVHFNDYTMAAFLFKYIGEPAFKCPNVLHVPYNIMHTIMYVCMNVYKYIITYVCTYASINVCKHE